MADNFNLFILKTSAFFLKKSEHTHMLGPPPRFHFCLLFNDPFSPLQWAYFLNDPVGFLDSFSAFCHKHVFDIPPTVYGPDHLLLCAVFWKYIPRQMVAQIYRVFIPLDLFEPRESPFLLAVLSTYPPRVRIGECLSVRY